MSGLQDENSFGAGGGTEGGGQKKRERKLPPRPDPAAVAATVNAQIWEAENAADEAIWASKAEFGAKKSEIADKKARAIDVASLDRTVGEFHALVPVIEQEFEIENLEAQLRQAKIDLAAKKAVFSAKKGELKTAYKTAVAGIKETVANDIANAKAVRPDRPGSTGQGYR